MIIVQFNRPPSVNTIWRSVNGRVLKSRDYRIWASQAAAQMRASVKGPLVPISKPCRVEFVWPRGSKNSDLDNRFKASCDALQESGIIADDRLIEEITGRWAAPGAELAEAKITVLGAK
jgi:Holliday junction resolvase RusA-like endonuclease